MKYTVIDYDPSYRAHVCDCHDGTTRLVDLLTNGDLGDIDPGSLVGKTLVADYEIPYITIAMHVSEGGVK